MIEYSSRRGGHHRVQDLAVLNMIAQALEAITRAFINALIRRFWSKMPESLCQSAAPSSIQAHCERTKRLRSEPCTNAVNSTTNSHCEVRLSHSKAYPGTLHVLSIILIHHRNQPDNKDRTLVADTDTQRLHPRHKTHDRQLIPMSTSPLNNDRLLPSLRLIP